MLLQRAGVGLDFDMCGLVVYFTLAVFGSTQESLKTHHQKHDYKIQASWFLQSSGQQRKHE